MSDALCFRQKLIYRLVLGSLFAVGVNTAFADTTFSLGTVQSSAATINQDAAPYQAPTQGSLLSTEPQSSLNQHYIEENASAASNYTDLVNIAPAIQTVNPNGPGMMETQSMTMRGFTDGQFNISFDGIPWGDSNDFTHHSTSYFMAQDLGSIVVDRGPGDASNLGDSTFGGTIFMNSKDPRAVAAFTPYATFGSFNTRMLGAEFDTGRMQNFGGSTAYINYRKLQSDGFLTNSGLNRGNLFIKFVRPLSNGVVTFVVMHNNLHQNVPGAISNADRAIYGYNFGLSTNPNSMSYYGYNYDDITTDMEYAHLITQLGDWNVDNKLYTYGYYHYGYNGDSPGDIAPGANPGLCLNAACTITGGANDVLGQQMYMLFRSWGDILQTSLPMASGKLDTGVWVDRQGNDRMERNVDYTLNGALVYTANAPTGYTRMMHNTLTTVQPYVQYEWKATDALTVTPGLKYSSFTRDLAAPVNQTKPTTSYYGSATWSKMLPALVARYAISDNWSAYAQYAQGFLAPNLNVFYSAAPDLGSMKPTETTNYQVGTTWKNQMYTVSADAYSIKSKNWMTPINPTPTTQTYVDAGDVNFSGGEVEGTVNVGGGFNLYGNYAKIGYSIKNPAAFAGAVSGGGGCGPAGDKLCDVPDNTYSAGVIYNQGPAYASLIAKQVGSRYSDAVQLGSYTIANLSASYTLKNDGYWANNLKLGFKINNLFDKTGPMMSNGATGTGQAYYVIPNRSYELSLSGDL